MFVVDGKEYAAAVVIAIGGHKIIEDRISLVVWEIIHIGIDVSKLEVHYV